MRLISTQGLDLFNTPAFYEMNGYTAIRIPGVITPDDGRIICYYECRRGGDWSPIDVGMQTSNDGGNTWTPTRIIADGKGRNACNNPVMIADGNALYFLYCENYKRLFICKSEDYGDHFSEPVELTGEIDRLMHGRFWSVIAVGPGHGVALKDHTLFVPIWFGCNRIDMFAHHPSYIAVLRGKERGSEWDISLPIGENVLKDPSECCIAILPEDRLLLNIRNENSIHRRAVAVGDAFDNTWASPMFDDSLPDPVCMAGLCNCAGDILFTNCANLNARIDLTMRKLNQDGRILESIKISTFGGYSDVCYSEGVNIACVAYENGSGHIQTALVSI